MGTQDDEIIIHKHVFLTKDNTIYKLPSRKKEFYSFFIMPGKDIKSFMKRKNVKHKNPDGLVEILEYINQQDQP
jgi:hypothetical protein